MNKKSIIFLLISVLLLITIGGFVYANGLSEKSSTINEQQSLQKSNEIHWKDSSDINALVIEATSGKSVVEQGDIADGMQPASLFKYITLGIALNENAINIDDVYECQGLVALDGVNYRCFEKNGHGKVNVLEGISNSCPISYIEIAKKIDNAIFYDYMNKMGFDLSSYFTKDNFTDADKIAIAMGQSIEITPKELLTAYNKILNSTEIFTSECSEKLLECMRKYTTSNSDIVFNGVCLMNSTHTPAAISITSNSGNKQLGIVFSEKANKEDMSNTIQQIMCE